MGPLLWPVRSRDNTKDQPSVLWIYWYVPALLTKRIFSCLFSVLDGFCVIEPIQLHSQNQRLIWNINQYIPPHWFLLAVFCLPVFIFFAIFCVNYPQTKICFVSYFMYPCWRDLRAPVRPSDTMTVWGMSGKGTERTIEKEGERHSSEQPDIGRFSSAA